MTIGTNAYRWIQHWQEQGSRLEDHLDESLAEAAEAGLEAWEPFWETEEHRDLYAAALPKAGLRMPSFYTPARLFGPDPDAEIARILARAEWARELGATIAVTNPDPVDWTGTPKPDDLLDRQTRALRTLAGELMRRGIRLAYHFHAPELLMGAREVHHTMLEIPAETLGVCFDAHWAWTGCGRSQIAVDDLVRMYGDRIDTLHVRQSLDGIWAETLTDGDVDYGRLFGSLKGRGWDGLVSVELAVMAETPRGLKLAAAHGVSVQWLRDAWSRAPAPSA